MSIPKVRGPNEKMSPEYRKQLIHFIERQGYLELMAANVFAHGLKYVHEHAHRLKILGDIEEELDHYARCVRLCKELGGDLEAFARRRMQEQPNRVPYPDSYMELAIVHFLLDRAGNEFISEYRTCSYEPYAQVVGKILDDEVGHEGYGDDTIKELCANPSQRDEAQRLFNKWLPISIINFGRADTPGDRYCREAGLRQRDNGEIMSDYLDSLKPVMAECGLTFPSKEEMGIDMPDDIDLTVPAAGQATS